MSARRIRSRAPSVTMKFPRRVASPREVMLYKNVASPNPRDPSDRRPIPGRTKEKSTPKRAATVIVGHLMRRALSPLSRTVSGKTGSPTRTLKVAGEVCTVNWVRREDTERALDVRGRRWCVICSAIG
jgi:hypothetical protein